MLKPPQLQEVDDVLVDFCRREPPAHVRQQLEYAFRIDGQSVTLVELRPAFRAEVGRMEAPIARFRFVATTATWQLFHRDRNCRWRRYPYTRPAKRLSTLFAEVRRDPTKIFWG